MKVTGIIAEYNPFHKGHRYQIDTLREHYAPDYVIAIMSGDFVQRGGPALLSKYARAEMALQDGIDLVLELPVRFATASAESFALGGIRLLQTTGIADSLCFGAESDDLGRLAELAHVLLEEPKQYRDALQSALKRGLPFPAARASALPEYADLLESPNNILAVAYLMALSRLPEPIRPILIQRIGSGYHEKSLAQPLPSASAIRACLLSKGNLAPGQEISALLPDSGIILQEYLHECKFLQENHFSLLLHDRLLSETKASLLGYEDVNEALAARILRHRNEFQSWDSFCALLKSRDMTYAHANRALTHILLGIKKRPTIGQSPQEDAALLQSPQSNVAPLPYLRVLGFRKSSAPLLRALKEHARAPILLSPTRIVVPLPVKEQTPLTKGRMQTPPAGHKQSLSPEGQALLREDLHASDLYRAVQTSLTGNVLPNEYNRKMLVVSERKPTRPVLNGGTAESR